LKNLNRIAVALCAMALVVPVAMANGPSGDHGNSGAPHGNANHPSKRCKHQPMVGYNYGGTLDATSNGQTGLVINVTRASHWAKSLKSTQVTISGADLAKVHYNGTSPFAADGTANPGVDLTKYNVQVIGRVGKPKKGCTFDNSAVTIKRVNVNAPDSSGTETETETTQTTTAPQS
jgi:hypothetical protein